MKVFIGTPCYGAKCYTSYVYSLIATKDLLNSKGIDVRIEFLSYESLIPRGRNTLIAKFMGDQSYTHIIFIDADIVWHPNDVLKLLSDDKDIIGGIYPLKKYNWDRIKNVNEENLVSTLLNYNLNFKSQNNRIEQGILEVRHVATGFMMIKREVIEKLIQFYPNKKYVDDIGCTSNDKEKEYLYSFFDCEIVEGHYLSEDWYFCENWNKIGGKVHADLNISLGHIGNEMYTGNTPKFITDLVQRMNGSIEKIENKDSTTTESMNIS